MKDWLRVTNQASPLTAGSRENTDRGAGKKETDERKSAIPGGDFPSSPVFPLAFSPTKAIQQTVQLENEGDRYREKEKHSTKLSYNCCLKKIKETEVMTRSCVALPEIVQGIHVAEEDSPQVLKQRMKGGIKGEIMEERGKC